MTLMTIFPFFFSKNEWCGKGRTKVMKRKRKRWVKTKNAEKEEKGKTKNAEKEEKGKTKNKEKEEKGETHKNNEKPILNNLEKKKTDEL